MVKLPPSLLWIDLETTGLDEDRDKILEIALATTDKDLSIRDSKSWVFPFDRVKSRMVMIPLIISMHEANGLWADCRKALNEKVLTGNVWLEIALWIVNNTLPGEDKPVMAGSSVQFDRMMLRQHAFTVESMFHYRNLDVSSFKNAAQIWAPSVAAEWDEIIGGEDKKTHRAMDDLEVSIEEMKFYLAAMRNGQWK